jgi:hypothetical protein
MSIVPGVKITTLMASAANGDTYGDAERRVFRGLQTLMQPNVKQIQSGSVPASPANGDTYIVGIATGLWAGQLNSIAYWAVDPQDGVATTGVWEFYVPQAGWTCFNQQTASYITWNGTSWAPPVVVPNKTTINPATGAIVFDASKGNSFAATLTGNVSFTITNPTDGQVIQVLWVQNATGGWSVTYPGNVHSIGFVGGAGATSPVDLQLATAAQYAILAPTVTNTGSSIITGGNVGATTATPGGWTLTPPAVLVTPEPAQANTDLGNAIAFYQGLTGTPIGASFASTTFTRTAPVTVFTASSTLHFTGGTITIDALGDPNAVFVFQVGSALNVDTGISHVVLANNAQASNIVWVVGSSATFDANPHTWAGDILAATSITLNGGTQAGRIEAHTGAVTISSATNITVAGAVAAGAFHAQPSPQGNSASSQSFTYNAANTTWYQTALGTYGM